MNVLTSALLGLKQKITMSNQCETESRTGGYDHQTEKDEASENELDSQINTCHESGHLAQDSDQQNDTDSDHALLSSETGSPQQKLTLKCHWPDCKKVFNKRRYFEDHCRSHTGERPFVCEYQGCYKSYTKKEHLKRHQKSHKPGTPRFSCPQCNQTYSLQANLTRHINRAHDEARFQCTVDDCKMSFKKNIQLKTHFSKIHGIKPFVCSHEDCKKEFARKSHFNQHLKSHKGYDCKEEGCDVHCETWSLMRKHVAELHNHEHTCEMCGKSFGSAQYRAHLKQHKKQRESFLCTYPDCHKAYFDRKNLTTHIKVFHEQATFPCTYEGCQATLVTKQKLQEHMTKIHDPVYVRKQKLKQKKKRKQRMEKYRKEKVVNEVMDLLLNKTEIKYCATTRREFEGREGGAPAQEVALQVVNEPGRPALMDIVSRNNDKGVDQSEPAENSASSGLGVSCSESDEDSDCSKDFDSSATKLFIELNT